MEELFVEIVKKWRIALSAALNIPEGILFHLLLFVYHKLRNQLFNIDNHYVTVDDERTKFVEDAVVEVQKAKRVLCASYVYGFYMLSSVYNRNILEFMQVNLNAFKFFPSNHNGCTYLMNLRI